MASIDVLFARRLLALGKKALKEHFPKLSAVKDAEVYNYGRSNFEFYGPDNFYWNGTADNAYEARYHGWMAYMKAKGKEV